MENKIKKDLQKIKTESPSKMAEGMAMHRFVESSKDEKERICYDPYAIYFISPHIIEFGKKHPEEAKSKVEQMEKLFPGLSSSIIARVRYFDDYVKKYIENGLEQLVILGAGYDTRAYRIEELKENIKVFEVDHPNTQSFKIEKIREIFASNSFNVTYVPVDIETQQLDQQLLKNGYNPTKRTLFVLEGLTMYITQESFENTLTFISKESGVGSSIIFDYYPKSVIDGTCKQEIGKNIRNFVIQQGEPLQFGIEDDKIEKFLTNHGFKDIQVMGSKDYKNTYFHGKNENRKVCDLLSFAHAVV
jgi:methyltransferase (TIGR00027 family)